MICLALPFNQPYSKKEKVLNLDLIWSNQFLNWSRYHSKVWVLFVPQYEAVMEYSLHLSHWDCTIPFQSLWTYTKGKKQSNHLRDMTNSLPRSSTNTCVKHTTYNQHTTYNIQHTTNTQSNHSWGVWIKENSILPQCKHTGCIIHDILFFSWSQWLHDNQTG